MAIEKKDELFEMNLGDGLIEISDTTEDATTVVAPVVEDAEKEKEKEKETPSAFKEHEDGTIEIDEALQATIAAGQKKKTEEDDENIDKTEKAKTEKEKALSSGDGSGDSSPSSSQYLAFARDRADEGVFLDFSEDDWKVLLERNEGNEAAALRELSDISVQQRINDGIDDYKESLTDQDRALYEAKEKGIPIDKYGKAKHDFDKYTAIKVADLKDNEKLQIDIISKGLEIKGFDKEEIADEIEGYKALEQLEARAEKVLAVLPKKFKGDITEMEESAAADDKSRQDRVRQGVARMKQFVDQTPEIIPGIKLTKPTRANLMKSMTVPIANDENGRPMNPVMATKHKNPQAFDLMIHYYHQLGLFNIDENGQMKPDFSKITKTAKNETVDKMRGIFESKEKQVTGTTKVLQSKEAEDSEFDAAFGRIGK